MSPSDSLYSNASNQDKFTEGVGLMTVDEVSFAGGVYAVPAVNTYYSRNSVSECSTESNCSVSGSYDWWTMSPYNFTGSAANVFIVFGSHYPFHPGSLNSLPVFDTFVVRPVISLKSNTLVSGSGTASDPYVVTGI